jgi:single-stranded DNA-binding protein
MNELRKTRSGKHNVHFIVANNLVSADSSKRLNSYIPCIAWGNLAIQLSQLPVNTKIKIDGELHSREHTKAHEDGSVEIRVAHELMVTSFEVLE